MATNILPEVAPMLADVDWPRFKAEAEALAVELYATWHAVNGLTHKEAGECAAAEVQRRYEAELAAAAQVEAKRLAAGERAERKALWHVAGGLDIRQAPDGAYLVPSGTRGGVVHRVSADGQACSCEASGPCWHLEAVAQAPARLVFPARVTLTRAA